MLLQAKVAANFSLSCLVVHDANVCKCSFCTTALLQLLGPTNDSSSCITKIPRFLVHSACYNVTDEAHVNEETSSPSRRPLPFGFGCSLHGYTTLVAASSSLQHQQHDYISASRGLQLDFRSDPWMVSVMKLLWPQP